MNQSASRADFFDASTLAKVFTSEPGSEVVRKYWDTRPTKYTTSFCFYESLNVLKGKWKFKNQLTKTNYLEAASRLTLWYVASSKHIDDLDFSNPATFRETRALVSKYDLDLSDAFQIMSVKRGYFSGLVRDSATILVTADNDLAVAAVSEGLRVWNVNTDSPPA